MPHWMTHPDHGTMPCYDLNEVSANRGRGWSFLNTGEEPNFALKAEQLKAPEVVTVTTPVEEAQPAEPAPDILDSPVVVIEPQLKGMGKLALEQLRAREVAGKTRKGLMALIDAELKVREA